MQVDQLLTQRLQQEIGILRFQVIQLQSILDVQTQELQDLRAKQNEAPVQKPE